MYILRKVTEDASKLLDTEVKDVVITCPAYFGTAERTATKNAGIIAGLNVLEIISEPTAAALYYGCAKEQTEKTILVFDLGGGTFDVTIMSISSEKIEVVCSDGNHELGGKDWDEAVMRYLAEEFISQTGFDGEFDEYAQQDMRLKAEKAKQQLLDLHHFSAKVAEKLEQVTGPFYIAQGELDRLVDPEVSIEMKEALVNAAVDFHWFEQSGHVITVGKEKAEFQESVLEFLNQQEWR